MKSIKDNITLFEDHTQSYYEWRKRSFKGLPLIHLDAHLDFAFFHVKKRSQALKEATTFKELKLELEKSFLAETLNKNIDKQENIGNYIYPAMREGIVKEFYWVIPGEISNSTYRVTERVFKKDPSDSRLIFDKKNRVLTGRVCEQSFSALTVDKLSVKKPLLLDIDVDYLMYKLQQEKPSSRSNLYKKNKKKDIERTPWAYPKEFVAILQKRFPNPAFITIAYSVNGGYTPILYKFFGDEIYLRLTKATDRDSLLDKLLDEKNSAIKNKDKPAFLALLKKVENLNIKKEFKDRFLAHINFWLFHLTDKALYYSKAIALDKTYKVKDNNYGWQYLKARHYKKAEFEFRRILKVDPKNKHALLGMSNLLFREKKYQQVISCLKISNSIDNDSCINVARAYLALGKYKLAGEALNKVKGHSGIAQYLWAKLIIEKYLDKKELALKHLKKAYMLGYNIKDIFIEAKRILDRKHPDYLLFKDKFDDYKKQLLKRKKYKVKL